MVHRFDHVFYGTTSIPAYSAFQIKASSNALSYVVSDVLVCINCFMRRRFIWSIFECVYVGCLFRLARCLFKAMFCIGGCHVRHAVDGDCVWNSVLVYGHSTSSYFQDTVRSGCLALKCVVRVARHGFCGWFQCCRGGRVIDEDIATNSEGWCLAPPAVVVALESCLALLCMRLDFGSKR